MNETDEIKVQANQKNLFRTVPVCRKLSGVDPRL